MADQSEAAITRAIMAWLKKQPDVFAWKVVGSTFSRRGLPDIAGNVGTAALYLEVKTVKGRLRPSQEVVAAEVASSGARVAVVRSLAEARTVVLSLRERQSS